MDRTSSRAGIGTNAHPGVPSGLRPTCRCLLVSALAGLVGCSGDAGSADPPVRELASRAGPAATCVGDTVVRTPLVLADGTELYLEPQSLIAVDGGFVLAGIPSYRWRVGPLSNGGIVSRNRILAVRVAGDSLRTVEKPLPLTPGAVRVASLGGPRWGALFSEAPPDSSPRWRARALWYAEWDGEAWSKAEPVPMPDEGALDMATSSPLVLTGSGLEWVAIQEGVGVEDREVFLYERRDGVWRREVVYDRFAEVATLAYDESMGSLLALAGEDPDLPGWQKSLRLYRRAGASAAWELLSRVVVSEPDVDTRFPRVSVLSGGVTVSWLAASPESSRAMARVGIGAGRAGEVVALDESSGWVVPLEPADGAPEWIVEHRNGVTGLLELRLLRYSAGEVALVQAVPDPYSGFFAALATASGEVLIVGPEFDPDPASATVRSLVLRLDPICT